MPEGEAQNFDANDLAQRDGFDVLADLLNSASEPSKPAIGTLARVSEIDELAARVAALETRHGNA